MNDKNISGTYVYRSLLNGQDVQTSFDKLEFGAGMMALIQTEGTVTGTLDMGSDYNMTLTGEVTTKGTDSFLSMTGYGVKGTPTEGWEYAYSGWIVPVWPNAVNQIPTITGSVLRVAAHGPSSPAGVMATFYMIFVF